VLLAQNGNVPNACHRAQQQAGCWSLLATVLLYIQQTLIPLICLGPRPVALQVYHALLSGRLDPGTAAVDAARLLAWQQRTQGSSTADDDDEQDSSMSDADEQQLGDEQQQQQQQLCLEDLLQLQLRGQAPFTVTAADLGDASLEPPPPPAAAAGDAAQPASTGSSSSSGLTCLSPGVYVIDLPLGGKPCYTLLQVLGYSRCARFGGWMTTVALSPVTGRKHQLRQHMAALGYPIVGDGK
jgi:hypothetical protein